MFYPVSKLSTVPFTCLHLSSQSSLLPRLPSPSHSSPSTPSSTPSSTDPNVCLLYFHIFWAVCRQGVHEEDCRLENSDFIVNSKILLCKMLFYSTSKFSFNHMHMYCTWLLDFPNLIRRLLLGDWTMIHYNCQLNLIQLYSFFHRMTRLVNQNCFFLNEKNILLTIQQVYRNKIYFKCFIEWSVIISILFFQIGSATPIRNYSCGFCYYYIWCSYL